MTRLPPETIAEFLERHKAERLAAGLPEHVEDPDVLDRIADIVLRSGAPDLRQLFFPEGEQEAAR